MLCMSTDIAVSLQRLLQRSPPSSTHRPSRSSAPFSLYKSPYTGCTSAS
jgi:hypothetical protein